MSKATPRVERHKSIPKSNAGRRIDPNFPYEKLGVNCAFVAGPYSLKLYRRVNFKNGFYGKKLGRRFCIRTIKNKIKVFRVS